MIHKCICKALISDFSAATYYHGTIQCYEKQSIDIICLLSNSSVSAVFRIINTTNNDVKKA